MRGHPDRPPDRRRGDREARQHQRGIEDLRQALVVGAVLRLPEGQRGLFTGGGATIRVADLIGKARMIDMMLSGRLYRGQEAVDVGLAQYLVEDSEAKAYEIARAAAQNPPLSNFAICSAISHMQNMSALDAAYAEAVVAGVVNTQEAAKARLEAFARGTAAKVKPQ